MAENLLIVYKILTINSGGVFMAVTSVTGQSIVKAEKGEHNQVHRPFGKTWEWIQETGQKTYGVIVLIVHSLVYAFFRSLEFVSPSFAKKWESKFSYTWEVSQAAFLKELAKTDNPEVQKLAEDVIQSEQDLRRMIKEKEKECRQLRDQVGIERAHAEAQQQYAQQVLDDWKKSIDDTLSGCEQFEKRVDKIAETLKEQKESLKKLKKEFKKIFPSPQTHVQVGDISLDYLSTVLSTVLQNPFHPSSSYSFKSMNHR